MNKTIYDMRSPNGQLFDTTILDEHSCQFVNGFSGEVVDNQLVAEALAVDCTTEPVKDELWWKR